MGLKIVYPVDVSGFTLEKNTVDGTTSFAPTSEKTSRSDDIGSTSTVSVSYEGTMHSYCFTWKRKWSEIPNKVKKNRCKRYHA